MNSKVYELYDWLKKSGQKEFSKVRLFEDKQWVIHFGDVESILAAGNFSLGEPNFEKLTATEGYDKTEEGFDFAYRLKDIIPLGCRGCVGEKAIIFRTNGIIAFHDTDSEPAYETIFWCSDADLSIYYTMEIEYMRWNGKIYKEWHIKDMAGNDAEIFLNPLTKWKSAYIPCDQIKQTLNKFFKNLKLSENNNKLDNIIQESISMVLDENTFKEIAESSARKILEESKEDELFLKAFNEKNIQLATELVRNKAAQKMPNTKIIGTDGKPLKMYHGTRLYDAPEKFNTFEFGHAGVTEENSSFFFTTSDTSLATEYASCDEETFDEWEYYFESEKPADNYDEYLDSMFNSNVYKLFVNLQNPLSLGGTNVRVDSSVIKPICDKLNIEEKDLISLFDLDQGYRYVFALWEITSTQKFRELIQSKGFDGTISFEGANNEFFTAGATKSNQLKSAEPFTFDDNNNLIPLSQRFNLNNNDIRF